MENRGKDSLKDLGKFLVGTIAGYGFFWLASHPTHSPVRKKLPVKKIKNVHILPEIHVEAKGRKVHLHHWFNLSFLYAILFATRKKHKILSKLTHGFLIGSILQGLSYKDRFKVVHFIEKKLEELDGGVSAGPT